MALLDLKTEGHQETVTIDGADYLLAPFEGFSITDQQKLRKDGLRLIAISKKKDPTDADFQDMETITMGHFDSIATSIPDEVKMKLLPGHRMELVNAYFLALAAALQKKAASGKNHPSNHGQRKGSRS